MPMCFAEYFYRLICSSADPHVSRSGRLSRYSTEIFEDLFDETYSQTKFWGLPVTENNTPRINVDPKKARYIIIRLTIVCTETVFSGQPPASVCEKALLRGRRPLGK